MKKLLFAIAVGGIMSSCTIAHTVTVTNNDVGSKVGVAEGSNFSKDLNVTAEQACRNGRITKVGTMEFKATQILFFVKYKTIVTGE